MFTSFALQILARHKKGVLFFYIFSKIGNFLQKGTSYRCKQKDREIKNMKKSFIAATIIIILTMSVVHLVTGVFKTRNPHKA